MPMMYSSTLLLNIRQKVGILIVFYPGSLKRTLYIGTRGVLFAGCNEPRAQEMVTCGDRCHTGLLYFPLPPLHCLSPFLPCNISGFFPLLSAPVWQWDGYHSPCFSVHFGSLTAPSLRFSLVKKSVVFPNQIGE